jgi:16S rRNA (adenine1518-N6/adenine1519-N6)-dimethyltransferase
VSQAPQANKNLGQHFLTNQGVIAKIADCISRLSPDLNQPVVEIGPGPGALTKELLVRGHKVIAVEIDTRMQEHLSTEFADDISEKKLEIWATDATKTDYIDRLSALGIHDLCVCGNLPYNVGTQILFLLLEKAHSAKSFCFMLQKEVVQRLIHREPGSKSYGVTGIKMSWACHILGHFWVKPGSFSPPPKVDSGVLWYERKQSNDEHSLSPILSPEDYASARNIVDMAFRQRRKMLKKSVPAVPECYALKRPDEITPSEFLNLIRAIGQTGSTPL